ncbi:MAG: antitoxin VapB family protein [Promethearchaeota archaeon]
MMATKTISIKEDVYNLLIGIKRKNESFSDLLLRLAHKEKSIDIIRNIAGSVDLGDTEALIKDIYERREEWRE